MRDVIIKKFTQTSGESIYKEDQLFEGFAEFFRNNGIDAKVNLATIKKHYGAHKLKGQRDGFVKLYLNSILNMIDFSH